MFSRLPHQCPPDRDQIIALDDDPTFPSQLVADTGSWPIISRNHRNLVAERRSGGPEERHSQSSILGKSSNDGSITIGALTITPDSYQVKLPGKTISLTRSEFQLLWRLASAPHRVFRDEDLYKSETVHQFTDINKAVRSW
jgi:DNA-binding response OmpR family regulator